jgi:cysteine desulfurase/selenocysteine lyase
MPIDLERARRETPGCEKVLHFNNAGAALMSQPVLDAVIQHLHLEASCGGYEAAALTRDRIERVYDALAEMLNAHRDEIAIIENATRAWDMAFYAIPFQPGDRILTARVSYASNYIAFLQAAHKHGISVEVVPNDEHSQIDIEALRAAIDERVKLIALTHIPTNGGLISPAAAVGRVAKEAGILYLLDACQSIGQMPLDVEAVGCDILSASGRKYLRGPRGTGFLYVRRAVIDQLEPPFLDLHAATWLEPDRYKIREDARRFENWETNVAGKIGLGVAVDYALSWGLDSIQERITHLAEKLRHSLAEIPGLTVQDLGQERCGIVTFTVQGIEPDTVKRALDDNQINVSISVTSSTLLDMQARGFDKLVRASVHYYNSEAEVERFCDVLRTIVLQ